MNPQRINKNARSKWSCPMLELLQFVLLCWQLEFHTIVKRTAKATTFLILGGGIVCATTALKLIAFWTPCECDDKIMDIVSPISDFVHFCVIIWGSIVVFGQYSQWDYVEKTSDHYCAYTPFMFAFVILILQWIFLPFILCCSIMLCCCAFCYKAVDDNDAAA